VNELPLCLFLPTFLIEGFDMNFSKRKTCMAIALAVSALGSAVPTMAATLIGGGSSLVGPSINAEIALFGATPDSLTYYITSSGTGQTAFLNDNASLFSTAASGTVYFANSDAAVTPAYITSYNSADKAAHGPLIQIPFIVTPIAIPYVNGPTSSTDTLSGPQTTPGQTTSLALNDADLCGIFSGNFTNWNQVANPDGTANFSKNAPITVVYRSDNSGTTELLTRHLAAVCPALGTTATGVTFVARKR
jgi:phosphate transport system substrate-binding protein